MNRIRLLWQKMREPVIDRFPKAPGLPRNIEAYMKRVNDAYVTDAYHSLSIEGYRVTPELIERVRSGTWNPEENEGDREQRNAMAARGYWQAYQVVQESVRRVLQARTPVPSRTRITGRGTANCSRRVSRSGLLQPGRPCRLSQRPGLYSEVDARAAEPRRGEGRHAGILRPAARRTRSRPSASCSGISCSSTSILIWTATAAWGGF